MRFRNGLDDVLASRGHLRILRALDALPNGLAVSVRDLARRAGITHPRASQILTGLNDVGLTTAQRAGRADLYQLNRDHALYPAIHGLFREEAGTRDQLGAFLRTRLTAIGDVREAYLFGSVARDDSSAGSDIDVAVVIPKRVQTRADDALEAVVGEARRRFGSELNVHTSTVPLRSRRRAHTGRDVWERIAEEGVTLVSERA